MRTNNVLLLTLLALSLPFTSGCTSSAYPRIKRAAQGAVAGNVARLAATLLTPVAGRQTTKRLDEETKAGKDCHFTGSGKFQWVAPNLFWFEQGEKGGNPLRYITVHPTTKQKLVVEPEDMFFDGASVPRWLWEVDSLGPFDFTYAALIHDWIFEAHHRYEIYDSAANNPNASEAHRARFRKERDKYAAYSTANMSLKDAGWLYAECIHLEMMRAIERLKLLNEVRASEVKAMKDGEKGANNVEGIDRLVSAVDISNKRTNVLGYHRWAVSSGFGKGVYDPKYKKSLMQRSPHTSTPTTVLSLLEHGKNLPNEKWEKIVTPELLKRFRMVADQDQKAASTSAASLPTPRQVEEEPLQGARLLKAAMQFYDPAVTQ